MIQDYTLIFAFLSLIFVIFPLTLNLFTFILYLLALSLRPLTFNL